VKSRLKVWLSRLIIICQLRLPPLDNIVFQANMKNEASGNFKMRCLKIDEVWVNMILSGKKTWEIRRQNTLIRGRIALGNTKTKCYVGYATITDSIEMTIEELKRHNDKHQANDFLDKYANGKKTLFAWILQDGEVEANPKVYTHSTGSWSSILSI
jgi:hypothetical protein